MAASSRANLDTSWRQQILQDLRARNRQQCHSYQEIISYHMKIFDNAAKLQEQNLQLTIKNEKLQQENVDLRVKSSGTNNGKQVDQIEIQKLLRLQEELTDLHKRKGDNAQQLIDLRNQLVESEKQIKEKEIRLNDIRQQLSVSTDIQHRLEQTVSEFEAANEVLRDEHHALQLAFTSLQEQHRKLQLENKDLVERWMQLKSRDADRLNDENATVIKKNRAKMQKELEEATKDHKSIDLDSAIPSLNFNQKVTVPDRVLHKLDCHDGEVHAVQCGPSGRLIATGGSDRKVKLWHFVKGTIEPKGTLRGSNAAVTSVEFNSDEELILGACNDFASRVWSTTDQRLRHTLTGHSGRVLSAKFLGDSAKVVSGSHDHTVKLWDMRSLACVRTIFAGSSCNDVQTDKAGSVIISGHFDKKIRFWDVRAECSANEILLQGKVTSLHLSPDGLYLLSCVRDDTLKLLDLRMTQVVGTYFADGFRVGSDQTRAVFSPDGQYISVGSSDGLVYVWSVVDCSKVDTTLREHQASVNCCSWQAANNLLVTCDRNKKMVVWGN